MEAKWAAQWVHEPDTVVIVTGAGSGIGQATALLAAQQGYRVAAWDVVQAGLDKLLAEAGQNKASIYPIICDLANEDDVKRAMKQTSDIGKPHCLVNNAGPVAIGKTSGFLEMCDAAMKMIHYPTTAFLETQPARGASIVNIASVVGPIFAGSIKGGEWYCAAKAAIVGFTKNLAVQSQGHIRANAVAPGGPVRTPRNSKFIDEGVFEKHLKRNPTGRPGEPSELANGIMFLLSPAASYINGHMLVIDGGLSVAE